MGGDVQAGGVAVSEVDELEQLRRERDELKGQLELTEVKVGTIVRSPWDTKCVQCGLAIYKGELDRWVGRGKFQCASHALPEALDKLAALTAWGEKVPHVEPTDEGGCHLYVVGAHVLRNGRADLAAVEACARLGGQCGRPK
jgi:hypothetical protein